MLHLILSYSFAATGCAICDVDLCIDLHATCFLNFGRTLEGVIANERAQDSLMLGQYEENCITKMVHKTSINNITSLS